MKGKIQMNKKAHRGNGGFGTNDSLGKGFVPSNFTTVVPTNQRIWHELIFECSNCRRLAKKVLRRHFPIKTSPKIIHVFAATETLKRFLDDQDIEHEPVRVRGNG